MLDGLLHDISVSLASSTNFRTALPKLAHAIHRHVAVVEVEIAELELRRDAVWIRAYAPTSRRRWQGERSPRFLERQAIDAPTFIDGGELGRVGLGEIASQFKLPLGTRGERGLLTISFEDPQAIRAQGLADPFTETLRHHCQAISWLGRTAERCHGALRTRKELYRNISDHDQPSDTVISVPELSSGSTDIPVASDVPLMNLDQAMIACISRALDATDGRIYGEGGAASILGLKPSTLQSKMRKLGIERRRFTTP